MRITSNVANAPRTLVQATSRYQTKKQPQHTINQQNCAQKVPWRGRSVRIWSMKHLKQNEITPNCARPIVPKGKKLSSRCLSIFHQSQGCCSKPKKHTRKSIAWRKKDSEQDQINRRRHFLFVRRMLGIWHRCFYWFVSIYSSMYHFDEFWQYILLLQ